MKKPIRNLRSFLINPFLKDCVSIQGRGQGTGLDWAGGRLGPGVSRRGL